MKRFNIDTERREQLVDVTHEVAGAVVAARLVEGAALVYCSHTTAGITINENADPDVAADLLAGLASMAPCDSGWLHCEGNSDAHIKASLVGSSVLVPIVEGALALGTWQGVFLCEFDGPRSRTVDVQLFSAIAPVQVDDPDRLG
jgi:secondary thiamine-phosphate synthase enzyme